MMRKRSRFSLKAPLLALAVLPMVACGPGEKQAASEAPVQIVRATTMTIGDKSLPGIYWTSGAVKAQFNATLSSKVLARVTAVRVREGDTIRQGQTLVSIDSRELQASVNMADANYRASVVGLGSARTAAVMERKTSQARIAQAESAVTQAQAEVAAAEARRDLAVAGPRTQEVAQSRIAVLQAESNLKLAEIELERATRLFEAGAVAKRDQDLAQNRYDVAKGQRDAAVQAESIAREGTRTQEIRAANEAVARAKAALKQVQAGVQQAKAAAMQVAVRNQDVEVASAQIKQSQAAAQAARVSLAYGNIVAPFDGRVVQRLADPGSMAGPGSPLLAVEGGDYRFEAVVPERLLGLLYKGAAATIRLDALNGGDLEGKVVEIVPQGDASSHSFVVKFALPATGGVKSGMFGRAAVRTSPTRKILIPQSAAWEREGLHYVFAVNQQGVARLRIVTLGETWDKNVEVLSGLNVGDRIVIGDRAEVRDGVKIESGKP